MEFALEMKYWCSAIKEHSEKNYNGHRNKIVFSTWYLNTIYMNAKLNLNSSWADIVLFPTNPATHIPIHTGEQFSYTNTNTKWHKYSPK